MDYFKWKLLIEAAELGSLSKVALVNRMSQPQVSRQIRDLEHECGGRLFHRTGRGVLLTELGERVVPKVRTWLTTTEQLKNDIKTTAGTPIGTVRLGVLPSTAHPLISQLYFILKKRYPQVKLVVREGQGAQLETWLDNGRVDLAILFRHSATPRNGDIYLIETGSYLVGATNDLLTSDSSIPFSALHNLPLILFCRPSSWRDHLDLLSNKYGISLNVVLEADSLGLQTHAVAEGAGYALLGAHASTAAVRECQLQSARLVEPEVPRYIALAMSPHGELTLACKTVMKITEEIAESSLTNYLL